MKPTYEFYEIETWLIIFSTLINLAYKSCDDIKDSDFDSVFNYYQNKYGKKDILFNIFNDLLPKNIADKMIYRMKIINNVHSIFYYRQDYAGLNHNLKVNYFNNTGFKNSL